MEHTGAGRPLHAAVGCQGFYLLPKRWVVERIHAWIEKARRLVRYHDRRAEASEAWVWLAAGGLLLNRLTHIARKICEHPLPGAEFYRDLLAAGYIGYTW